MSQLPLAPPDGQSDTAIYDWPVNLPMRDPVLSSNGGTYGIGPTTALNFTNNPSYTMNAWKEGPYYTHHIDHHSSHNMKSGAGLIGDIGDIVKTGTDVIGLIATATGVGAPEGQTLQAIGKGTKVVTHTIDKLIERRRREKLKKKMKHTDQDLVVKHISKGKTFTDGEMKGYLKNKKEEQKMMVDDARNRGINYSKIVKPKQDIIIPKQHEVQPVFYAVDKI